MGTSYSSAYLINDNDTLSSLLAFFSFPISYETSLPNDVQYSLYTQE